MEVRCQKQKKKIKFYKDASEPPDGKIVEVEYSGMDSLKYALQMNG